MWKTLLYQSFWDVTRLFSVAILIYLNGLGQVADACTIGVGEVNARGTKAETEKNEGQGEVRFRITSVGCPSEGSNQVMVGALPLDETGTLRVTGWTANPISVSVPASGISRREQTLEFKASGSGGVKFQVSITACNGQSCGSLGWEGVPNHVQTNVVSFSQEPSPEKS